MRYINPDTGDYIHIFHDSIKKSQTIINLNCTCNIVFKKKIDGSVEIEDLTVLLPKHHPISTSPPYPELFGDFCTFDDFRKIIAKHMKEDPPDGSCRRPEGDLTEFL